MIVQLVSIIRDTCIACWFSPTLYPLVTRLAQEYANMSGFGASVQSHFIVCEFELMQTVTDGSCMWTLNVLDITAKLVGGHGCALHTLYSSTVFGCLLNSSEQVLATVPWGSNW